ncbi:hypothetical protein BGX38DRAFT_1328827 [Terfezia claveryi]|nr:hypothetical protein BGX38DRAFT_1328827 [Terfezia claveryi]
MPRISQRKALIEWFLGGIERHQAHLDQERFQDFLRRTMRQLQQGLDEAMNMVEPSGDDESSVTCAVTVTISESDESDSMSSLLSSEWDDDDELRYHLIILQVPDSSGHNTMGEFYKPLPSIIRVNRTSAV